MLPTEYQNFIALSRYAKWLENEGRRETWEETVDRYCDFMLTHARDNTKISKKDYKELERLFNET
jgi:ribonucleoside-diphosphate reductase alpha chain